MEIDETYEQNLIKEVEEEIGIRNITIKLSHKTKPESWFQYFIQYFTSVLDIPIEGFELQESEVENIRWVSPNDLQEAVNNNPEHFVPYFQKIALLFISENSFQT